MICDDNYRQGVSVISVRNLLIENCTLQNTEGAAPAAGIDFEPNKPDEFLINCVMRNCTMKGNAGFGFVAAIHYLTPESEPISLCVENCTSDANKKGSVWVHSPAGAHGWIDFVDSKLKGQQRMDLNKQADLQVRFDPEGKQAAE